MMDEPYAEWKERNKYHEAEREKWKSDLAKGQIVVAVEDIEMFEGSRNYVPEGTQGVVYGPSSTTHEWNIRWKTKRDTWSCYYKPTRVNMDATEAWDAFIEVEFVPLELWQKFYPDVKADAALTRGSTEAPPADQRGLFDGRAE
jgi:hypothetical protein